MVSSVQTNPPCEKASLGPLRSIGSVPLDWCRWGALIVRRASRRLAVAEFRVLLWWCRVGRVAVVLPARFPRAFRFSCEGADRRLTSRKDTVQSCAQWVRGISRGPARSGKGGAVRPHEAFRLHLILAALRPAWITCRGRVAGSLAPVRVRSRVVRGRAFLRGQVRR